MNSGENDLPPVWYGKKKKGKAIKFPEPVRFWETWRFYLVALVVGSAIAFFLSGCVSIKRHRIELAAVRSEVSANCLSDLKTIEDTYKRELAKCRTEALQCEGWFD